MRSRSVLWRMMIDYKRIPKREALEVRDGWGVYITKDELRYLLDIVDEYQAMLANARALADQSERRLAAKAALGLPAL